MTSSHHSLPRPVQQAAQWLLWIAEPLVLLFMILAFWHHSPPIRDEWVWLLWLALPVFRLRMFAQGRVWTWTPLNDWLLLFILLTALNDAFAPYSRASYIAVVSRPLLGIWLYLYFVEHARTFRRMDALLVGSIGVGAVLAVLALTATQWTPDKGAELAFITDALPRIDYRQWGDLFANMLLGFNPNEIAGALAWMTPLLAGVALTRKPAAGMGWRAVRISAGIVFALLLLALFLGQSRFAIGGVVVALALLATLLLKNRWRYVALAGVGVIVLLQAALLLNIFDVRAPDPAAAQAGLSSRDQRTFTTRLDIWQRGLQMMLDYPATGVGMSMYRGVVGLPQYEIEYYVVNGGTPPHTHNEWIQMGADLGVPGFALYIIWQVVVLWMLWRGWRTGNPVQQGIAAAIFAGLLAHAAYGFGDAVTLWDRYSFVLWWLVGLAGAQYVLARESSSKAVGKAAQ